MSDLLDIVVECDSPEQVWSVLLDINNNRFTKAERVLFTDLLRYWLTSCTKEHVFRIARGKSIGELIREHGTDASQSLQAQRPVASDQLDGKSWTLHAPPGTPDAK